MTGARASHTERSWPAPDARSPSPGARSPEPEALQATALGRTARWLTAEARGMALGIALQVLALATGVALMATSAWLVARAAERPSIAALQIAIVGVRFFGISRGLLRYLERLVTHDATLRLVSTVRQRVFAALAPLSPARLVERRSGDLLARLVSDVDTIEHLYLRVLAPMSAALLTLAIVAGLLGAIHPRVAVLAALGWVAAGVCAPLVARGLARGAGAGVVAVRTEMHALAVDGVQGLADLAALGADARHAAAMADAARRVAVHERRAARGTATGAAIGGLTVDLAAIGVLALCVPLVGAGHVQGVLLAVAVLATIASFEALAGLPAAWQGLDASGAAAARLWDVLDDTPAVVSPATPAPLPAARDLEVRRLEFTYPGAISRAVCDLSFRLEPGRMVAIVGPSGAGKSTVAHLLLRFWEVPRGSVFVGGRDVRDHDPDDVRRLFGFAGQRAHLFTGTVRDNLLVGRPGASAADLDRALGRAHLGAAIDACPGRLDTWIGEQGHALSGGERQRLGLARALLAETPFLLLDEPTANVDPETERALMGEIRACAARRGVLLITHWLVGLDRADEIILLREGIVVERGTFGELVARGGAFRRMLDLQRSAAIVDTER